MKHQKMISKSREIQYYFTAEYPKSFNETVIRKLLEKAIKEGIISEYDTGRGHVVWFNGAPCKELRHLRDQIKDIVETW